MARLSDGRAGIDAPDQSVDRFVSNFVLTCYPATLIGAVVDEAYSMLQPGDLPGELPYENSALTRGIASLAIGSFDSARAGRRMPPVGTYRIRRCLAMAHRPLSNSLSVLVSVVRRWWQRAVDRPTRAAS